MQNPQNNMLEKKIPIPGVSQYPQCPKAKTPGKSPPYALEQKSQRFLVNLRTWNQTGIDANDMRVLTDTGMLPQVYQNMATFNKSCGWVKKLGENRDSLRPDSALSSTSPQLHLASTFLPREHYCHLGKRGNVISQGKLPSQERIISTKAINNTQDSRTSKNIYNKNLKEYDKKNLGKMWEVGTNWKISHTKM